MLDPAATPLPVTATFTPTQLRRQQRQRSHQPSAGHPGVRHECGESHVHRHRHLERNAQRKHESAHLDATLWNCFAGASAVHDQQHNRDAADHHSRVGQRRSVAIQYRWWRWLRKDGADDRLDGHGRSARGLRDGGRHSHHRHRRDHRCRHHADHQRVADGHPTGRRHRVVPQSVAGGAQLRRPSEHQNHAAATDRERR